MALKRTSHDLLRRFTSTPLVSDLAVMGRVIRLQTNKLAILKAARHAFVCYQDAPLKPTEFLWRIVGEGNHNCKAAWPEMTAMGLGGLHFVNFGQRGFLAADLEAQEAVAFLAEDLVQDEAGFKWPFLATLFSLSAPALGLTPCSAACLASGEKGLLILRPSNRGSRTISHLAGRLGLPFFEEHVTFLECEGVGLRAWGQFWPVPLQRGALSFLPQLSTAMQRSVTLVASVVLAPQKSEVPRITPIGSVECNAHLEESFLLRQYENLEPRRNAVRRALSQLRAYALNCGSDPAEAVAFIASLLRSAPLLGARA